MGKRNPSVQKNILGYDPSAGSPTETLLRLLLPTNEKVQLNSFPNKFGKSFKFTFSFHW